MEVLKEKEVNLNAEAERARNKQQQAEQAADAAAASQLVSAAALDQEKIVVSTLCTHLKDKFVSIAALEQKLLAAACQVHGYGDRVQFAVGRIKMAQV